MSLVKKIGKLDDRDPAPLYVKLQRALREAVHNKTLAPDDALPPERDLAEEFGISRITVRKALSGLVEEGLLSRRQGAGTFIASRVEKHFSRLSSFSEDMAARGLVPRSEWLGKTGGTVTPEESLMLGLSPGTRVYRFNRIRYANDTPMAIEYSTILAACLPSEDAVEDSLYGALSRTGNRPTRALQRLRAVSFDEHHARLLDMEIGAAGLLIERRGFLADGRTIEVTRSYYRGDAYDFVAELNA